MFGPAQAAESLDDKQALTVAERSPPLDIEVDKEYPIKAETQEIRKRDSKLNVHNDVLTVPGER